MRAIPDPSRGNASLRPVGPGGWGSPVPGGGRGARPERAARLGPASLAEALRTRPPGGGHRRDPVRRRARARPRPAHLGSRVLGGRPPRHPRRDSTVPQGHSAGGREPEASSVLEGSTPPGRCSGCRLDTPPVAAAAPEARSDRGCRRGDSPPEFPEPHSPGTGGLRAQGAGRRDVDTGGPPGLAPYDPSRRSTGGPPGRVAHDPSRRGTGGSPGPLAGDAPGPAARAPGPGGAWTIAGKDAGAVLAQVEKVPPPDDAVPPEQVPRFVVASTPSVVGRPGALSPDPASPAAARAGGVVEVEPDAIRVVSTPPMPPERDPIADLVPPARPRGGRARRHEPPGRAGVARRGRRRARAPRRRGTASGRRRRSKEPSPRRACACCARSRRSMRRELPGRPRAALRPRRRPRARAGGARADRRRAAGRRQCARGRARLRGRGPGSARLLARAPARGRSLRVRRPAPARQGRGGLRRGRRLGAARTRRRARPRLLPRDREGRRGRARPRWSGCSRTMPTSCPRGASSRGSAPGAGPPRTCGPPPRRSST